MPMHVCNGATMICSFGAAPSTLIVLPVNQVMTSSQPAATIMDHVPMVNIAPFGMCLSVANPTVAAATSAALGVLTPMPCIPNTPAPWTPPAGAEQHLQTPVCLERDDQHHDAGRDDGDGAVTDCSLSVQDPFQWPATITRL